MIEIKPGDIFFTKNPMALGQIIDWVQTLWSTDNASEYSHSGILLNPRGATFEALWTIRQAVIEEHIGNDIAVYRFDKMTHKRFQKAFMAVSTHKGQWYPAYRLFLMAVPPLGKYLSFGRVVCSELVGKFLANAGVEVYWRGLNPDGLYDFVKNHRNFSQVYKGTTDNLLKEMGEPK